MQSVADDMSSAGMKKYEGYEKQMFAMFDVALPYFIKAEEVDPTDKNTIDRFKERYMPVKTNWIKPVNMLRS